MREFCHNLCVKRGRGPDFATLRLLVSPLLVQNTALLVCIELNTFFDWLSRSNYVNYYIEPVTNGLYCA